MIAKTVSHKQELFHWNAMVSRFSLLVSLTMLLMAGALPKASPLKATTSVETFYYGTPRFTNFFLGALNHCNEPTQLTLWRLLTNHDLPLSAAWSHRILSRMEAATLVSCYATWPGDQIHVIIPFSYLLQQPILADMVKSKRNFLDPVYYRIPLIDLPPPDDPAELTSIPINTSMSLLGDILQPQLHEYWLWSTDKMSELLPSLEAQDAWDICDWLYSEYGGSYSSTMRQQKSLAFLGAMFGGYVMYNSSARPYEQIYSFMYPHESDPELASLGLIVEDSGHYYDLVARIERFTEQGTARRTLWRAKLLLLTLEFFLKECVGMPFLRSYTAPQSPAQLVKEFFTNCPVEHLPPFYLNRLMVSISKLGILTNLLLYEPMMNAHRYSQTLVLEQPLPHAPLSQHIWRWRQLLWKQFEDSRGVCNETRRKWRFFSSRQLLNWWADYDELGPCLLMDPTVHIELMQPTQALVVVRRLEKLLPYIVQAHAFVSTNTLDDGYMAGQRALARTIGSEVLYQGALYVALSDRQKELLSSPDLDRFHRWTPNLKLCQLLQEVGFQENVPVKLLFAAEKERKRSIST